MDVKIAASVQASNTRYGVHISGAGTLHDEDSIARASRAGLTARAHASEPTINTFNNENTGPYGVASPRDYRPDVHEEK